MTAAKAIHRADLNGRAICGARGRVIISSALWTCADCQRLSAPANRYFSVEASRVETLIYRGHHHVIMCDGAAHHQVNENGERIENIGTCVTWMGGCPSQSQGAK